MPDFYVEDHGTQVPIQQYGLVIELKRLKNFSHFYCPPRQHHPRKGFSGSAALTGCTSFFAKSNFCNLEAPVKNHGHLSAQYRPIGLGKVEMPA
jgi:hypothetical protein